MGKLIIPNNVGRLGSDVPDHHIGIEVEFVTNGGIELGSPAYYDLLNMARSVNIDLVDRICLNCSRTRESTADLRARRDSYKNPDPARCGRDVHLTYANIPHDLQGNPWVRPEQADRQCWNLVIDGSAGWELRTPPSHLVSDSTFALLSDFFAAAKRELDAESNARCGTHVHLDMTEVTPAVIRQLILSYILLEPMMLAPISPHRYGADGYNPIFSNFTAQHIGQSPDNTLHHLTEHRSSLSTYALQTHGTLEFRSLQGTLDATVISAWSHVIGRMFQAASNHQKQGIKFIGAMPSLRPTPKNIRHFLKFLDLERDDLSPGLKAARSWYLVNVRRMHRRKTYQDVLLKSINRVDFNTELPTIGTDGQTDQRTQVYRILNILPTVLQICRVTPPAIPDLINLPSVWELVRYKCDELAIIADAASGKSVPPSEVIAAFERIEPNLYGHMVSGAAAAKCAYSLPPNAWATISDNVKDLTCAVW